MLNEFKIKTILNALSDFDIKAFIQDNESDINHYYLFVEYRGFLIPIFMPYKSYSLTLGLDSVVAESDDALSYANRCRDAICKKFIEFDSYDSFDMTVNEKSARKITPFLFSLIADQQNACEELCLINIMPEQYESYQNCFEKIYDLLIRGHSALEAHSIVMRDAGMDTDIFLERVINYDS